MSLRLEWSNEQEEVPLPNGMEDRLKQLLELVGKAEGIQGGEVALTFVDDKDIQELNRHYRNKDKPTDVLSFSMLEGSEGELSIRYDLDEDADTEDEMEFIELPEEQIGDIVISLPTALRQSEEYGHSLEREIGFLFVHDFLHLIGYDHEDEESERVMTEKQEHILLQAGLSR